MSVLAPCFLGDKAWGGSRESLSLESQGLIQENDRICPEQVGIALRQLIRKDRGSCVDRRVRRKELGVHGWPIGAEHWTREAPDEITRIGELPWPQMAAGEKK